jgi:hypothetical protein
MRRVAIIAIGVLLAAGSAAVAFLRSQSVTGQLIDLACYSQDASNTGNHHRNRGLICAQACAREGFAVGLLTSDGTVYQVAGGLTADSNAKLVPHMTETVIITGDVTEGGGQLTIAASDLRVIR